MGYDPLVNFDFNDLEVTDEFEIKFINIKNIKMNKDNFERTNEFKEKIEDLDSFKKNLEFVGLINPIKVAEIGEDEYRIISGHYRYYCLCELFKENKKVYYKDRELINNIPCIIDHELSNTKQSIELIASNAKNNSVKEKVYQTKKAMELHERLLKKDKSINPNRNEFIAMITGYSIRSVQMYINQIKNEKEEEPRKENELTSESTSLKTKSNIKTVISCVKKLDDILENVGAENLEYIELTPKKLADLNEMLINIKLNLEIVSAKCLRYINLAKAENNNNDDNRYY